MRLDPAREPLRDEKLTLAECYELCRRVQKAHSRTYHFCTLLLPAPVRSHVYALYAFMRYADEIVDNPGETRPEEQLAKLKAFERETISAIAGSVVSNPVLRAFAGTVRERDIRLEDIMAFMASMKMDTYVFRYPTYEDLGTYTYGSAAVVGLMMCRILGVTDARAAPHAAALGLAMQLTNFLRDIGEDWLRGRVYLPLEDLERFGYTEEDLGAGVVDERFARLMRFEIRRARHLYGAAEKGLRYIPAGCRYPVSVACELYATILDRIESRGYDVFSGRAETTFASKLALAAACAAREPRELAAWVWPGKPAEIALDP